MAPVVDVMRLGIDPGHGGARDRGTDRHGLVEKEENMRLALELCHTLPWDRVEVELLRQGDDYLPLADRGARSVACDWVVSIHINAAPLNLNQRGAEVYILPGGRLAERRVAKQILTAMPKELRTTRVIEALNTEESSDDDWLQRPYNVLSPHAGKVVLVEVGYASNAADRAVMLTDWGRMAIVSAIRSGVAQMLREVL